MGQQELVGGRKELMWKVDSVSMLVVDGKEEVLDWKRQLVYAFQEVCVCVFV